MKYLVILLAALTLLLSSCTSNEQSITSPTESTSEVSKSARIPEIQADYTVDFGKVSVGYYNELYYTVPIPDGFYEPQVEYCEAQCQNSIPKSFYVTGKSITSTNPYLYDRYVTWEAKDLWPNKPATYTQAKDYFNMVFQPSANSQTTINQNREVWLEIYTEDYKHTGEFKSIMIKLKGIATLEMIPATSVTCGMCCNIQEVHEGKTLQAKVNMLPKNNTSTVRYRSSNSNIVSVTTDGLITGVVPGKAVVTATVYTDNIATNLSTTFNIEVYKKGQLWAQHGHIFD